MQQQSQNTAGFNSQTHTASMSGASGFSALVQAAAPSCPPPRPRRPIPPKLYRIGEVAGYLGVSRQTIHNYTIMGLLQESTWSQGGHRLYDEGVFGRLDRIVELKAQRVPLQQIRQELAGPDG